MENHLDGYFRIEGKPITSPFSVSAFNLSLLSA